MADAINLLALWLLVGLVAGGLAGQITKGYGLSFITNLLIGVIGGIIGGVLLVFFLNIHIGEIGGRIIAENINATIGIEIGGRIIAAIINATIGAVMLLVIHWLIERA
jgi:uncharacterized membrane protein YeaQ/YmgE (transglycosylase-associated protein family)